MLGTGTVFTDGLFAQRVNFLLLFRRFIFFAQFIFSNKLFCLGMSFGIGVLDGR
jgi:hypothetical protein